MRVSVIGTGYVGLVSGACLAEIGHDCVCVDLDPSKVDRINRGEAPIHEPGLAQMLFRHAGRRLRATTDLHTAVMDSDITFIAVGTPFDGMRIDLQYVCEASRQIGETLRDKTGYHVVVMKSTVVPTTTDKVVKPLLEQASGKRAGEDFGLGMNPEFLTEGTAVEDFMHPDRIVLGGMDPRTIEAQRQVYAAFQGTPVQATNNTTAEMIKYASNSILATMISFSNEIGNVCSALGDVDVADVMHGVHAARYFTTRIEDERRVKSAITSFLWAGCGYGGSCLPKDTKALSAHAAAHGAPMPLLDAVIATNLSQPQRMVTLLEREFPDLNGCKVALLGLAFKQDTDDMRESPAIPLAEMLIARGVTVIGYDPVARDTARAALPPQVTLAQTLDEALKDVDAALLVTRWEEFLRVPQIIAGLYRPPLIVDGRRMIDPTSVPRYAGIGR